MKIPLFGKNGQVGWELLRSLAPLGELIAFDSDSTDFCGDFTDLEGLVTTIRCVAPDVIVNAAAQTAVDKAESESELARTINAAASGVLTREAKALGGWLVDYSTDYVFDDSGAQPWRDEDATRRLSIHDATKLEGEQAIHATGGRHLITTSVEHFRRHTASLARGAVRMPTEILEKQ